MIGSHNVANLLLLNDSFVSFVDESTNLTQVRLGDWNDNSGSKLWVGPFEPGNCRGEVTGILGFSGARRARRQ